MKSIKLATTAGILLFSTVLFGAQASAEPGPIPANRDTEAQVKFIEDDAPTDPTDPTNPDKPVDQGTNGPLSLDFASILDFSTQLISNKNQTYFAKPQYLKDKDGNIDKENPVPNYAQLTDKRGGEKGWSLSVKQNGQFKSSKNQKELTGAQITFLNAEAATISSSKAPSTVKETFSLGTDGQGVAENVMAASEGEGFGTWVYRFGDENTMSESIKLDVPGSTVKELDTYKTTLTWTLTDTPANAEEPTEPEA